MTTGRINQVTTRDGCKASARTSHQHQAGRARNEPWQGKGRGVASHRGKRETLLQEGCMKGLRGSPLGSVRSAPSWSPSSWVASTIRDLDAGLDGRQDQAKAKGGRTAPRLGLGTATRAPLHGASEGACVAPPAVLRGQRGGYARPALRAGNQCRECSS